MPDQQPSRLFQYLSITTSDTAANPPAKMYGKISLLIGWDELLSNPKSFIRALMAELIATTILFIAGIGSGLPSITHTYTPNFFQTAIGGGLTVVAAVQMSLSVSGAHLNPAVTIAMFVVGQAKLIRCLFYICIQIIAGIFAAWFLVIVQPNNHAEDLLVKPADGLTDLQFFAVEFAATFILMMPACTIADKKAAPCKGLEPILMALTVISCHLFALKYSGCGLNPARVLGAAIVARNCKNVWIYICAEISAGVIGSLVYFFAVTEREEVPPKQRSDSIQIFPRTLLPDPSPKNSFVM